MEGNATGILKSKIDEASIGLRCCGSYRGRLQAGCVCREGCVAGQRLAVVCADLELLPCHCPHPAPSPTNALYIRQGGAPGQGSGGSSLSAGAIAGIAVGAAAVAVAAAAAGWVIHRRQRAARAVSAASAKPDGSAAPGAAKLADGGGSGRFDGVFVAGALHSSGDDTCSPGLGSAPASRGSAISVGSSGGGGFRGMRHPAASGLGGSGGSRPLSPFAGGPHQSGGSGSAHALNPFAAGPRYGGGSAPASSGSGGAGAAGGGNAIVASMHVPQLSARVATSPFAAARSRAMSVAMPGGGLGGGSGSLAFGGTPSAGLSTSPSSGLALSPAASGQTRAAMHAEMLSSGSSQGGAAAGAPPGASPATLDSAGTSASSAMLPELAQHIAEQEAAQQFSYASELVGGELLREHSLISAQALSPGLRDWLVDINDIEFQRHPNGMPQELGAGARCAAGLVARPPAAAARRSCRLHEHRGARPACACSRLYSRRIRPCLLIPHACQSPLQRHGVEGQVQGRDVRGQGGAWVGRLGLGAGHSKAAQC